MYYKIRVSTCFKVDQLVNTHNKTSNIVTSQQVLPGKEEWGWREADQEVGELHWGQGKMEDIHREGSGKTSRFFLNIFISTVGRDFILFKNFHYKTLFSFFNKFINYCSIFWFCWRCSFFLNVMNIFISYLLWKNNFLWVLQQQNF